jgi:ABC-type branched-subunit amino acid transport system permease subunit
MDWGLIITNALRAMVGLDTVVFALAAIGLNVHFGYTGLLNFGQSAFLAVAGYGLAITVAEFGLPTLVGCRRRPARRGAARPAAGRADAAAASRLPRHRDDRGSGDRAPAVPVGVAVGVHRRLRRQGAVLRRLLLDQPVPRRALRHRPRGVQRAAHLGPHGGLGCS